MHVTGIDLSGTATGIVRVHGLEYVSPDPSEPLPEILRTFSYVKGATGLTTMNAGEAISTMDLLVENIVRAAIGSAEVSTGPVYPRSIVMERATVAGPAATGGLFERGYIYFSLLRALFERNIPVLLIPPSVLKVYATGKGNAGKGAMIDAVARRFPMFETGGDDNLADAAVCAALAAALVNCPLAKLPATHLAALATATGGKPARKTRARKAEVGTHA
jgi:hypothetical protein